MLTERTKLVRTATFVVTCVAIAVEDLVRVFVQDTWLVTVLRCVRVTELAAELHGGVSMFTDDSRWF